MLKYYSQRDSPKFFHSNNRPENCKTVRTRGNRNVHRGAYSDVDLRVWFRVKGIGEQNS